MAPRLTTRVENEQDPKETRIYFQRNGQAVSPWHDIPLYVEEIHGVLNMVLEIPRHTTAKMEISKEIEHNPIVRDTTSEGEPRSLPEIAPFTGYPCNYGAFPRTWEDPNMVDEWTGIKGDNDPLDACEIGSENASCGQVKAVKVLGAFAIIDQGETDWKVVVIDVNDPLAPLMQDISDVETSLPGFLDSLKKWYQVYKIPASKKANELALNGENRDRRFALELVKHFHQSWKSGKLGK